MLRDSTYGPRLMLSSLVKEDHSLIYLPSFCLFAYFRDYEAKASRTYCKLASRHTCLWHAVHPMNRNFRRLTSQSFCRTLKMSSTFNASLDIGPNLCLKTISNLCAKIHRFALSSNALPEGVFCQDLRRCLAAPYLSSGRVFQYLFLSIPGSPIYCHRSSVVNEYCSSCMKFEVEGFGTASRRRLFPFLVPTPSKRPMTLNQSFLSDLSILLSLFP
ncbi:hypothetical protein DFH11DRAFT_1176994 [Phellopilus nigrolimitatus]|nr:hypothetical protein DFH11DRAFT_1176994 [Phellopilus nigrolimitatus]